MKKKKIMKIKLLFLGFCSTKKILFVKECCPFTVTVFSYKIPHFIPFFVHVYKTLLYNLNFVKLIPKSYFPYFLYISLLFRFSRHLIIKKKKSFVSFFIIVFINYYLSCFHSNKSLHAHFP